MGFLFDETKKVKMMNFSPFKANINSFPYPCTDIV